MLVRRTDAAMEPSTVLPVIGEAYRSHVPLWDLSSTCASHLESVEKVREKSRAETGTALVTSVRFCRTRS